MISELRHPNRFSNFQLFIALLLGFQVLTIIGNVAVSLLLGNFAVKTKLGSSPPSDLGLCSLQWYSNVKLFERSPPSSHHDRSSSNGLFDAHYLHFLINGSSYNGVDKYTSYTLQVLGTGAVSRRRRYHNWPSAPRGQERIIHDVTSFRYSIDVGPCSKASRRLPRSKRRNSLFIGVVSAPRNFERRRDIRRTWLRHFKNDRHQFIISSSVDVVGFAFVIGQMSTDEEDSAEIQSQIEEESLAYGDILQVEMVDKYYDLAIKGVAFFNWLNNNCADVDYIFKLDDDVYVNVRNLTSLIAALHPKEEALSAYGFNLSEAIPQRDDPKDVFAKWAVSWELWPWKTYPPYLYGPSVLIPGGEGVRRLLEAAKTVPYYPIDDVYLNGLLAEKANISIEPIERFYCPEAPEEPPACYIQWTASWLTNTSEQMYSSHEAVENFYYYNSNAMIANYPMMNNDSVDTDEMARWQCNASTLPLYADNKRCLKLPIDWNKDEESNNNKCAVPDGPPAMISLDLFYELLEKYQLLLARLPPSSSTGSNPTTLAAALEDGDGANKEKFIRGHAIDN